MSARVIAAGGRQLLHKSWSVNSRVMDAAKPAGSLPAGTCSPSQVQTFVPIGVETVGVPIINAERASAWCPHIEGNDGNPRGK